MSRALHTLPPVAVLSHNLTTLRITDGVYLSTINHDCDYPPERYLATDVSMGMFVFVGTKCMSLL